MKSAEDSSAVTIAELLIRLEALKADAARQIAELNRKIKLINPEVPSRKRRNSYWLSPGETALRLGITTRTLINRRLRGEIPAECWRKENSRYYCYLEEWVNAAHKFGLGEAAQRYNKTAA